MPKLKLGPLPDDKPIKLTITVSAELAALLKAYAEAVGSADGHVVAIERLIPPIVERFVRSDRAFMRQRKPPLAGEAAEPVSRPSTRSPD